MTTQVKEPTAAAAAPETVSPAEAAVPAATAPPTALPADGLTRLRRKFTVAEYYRMAEEGILQPTERVELIDGVIFVMAPIGRPHAVGVRRMEQVLHQALGAAATISVQNPLRLDDYSDPEPDIAVLRLREDEYLTAHPGPEDTLLVMEVADSTLAFDLEVKSRRYAAAGIPEMWVMNLPGDCIDRLDLPMPAGYARHTIFRRGETLRPAALPGLELAVDDLLPPRPRRQGAAVV